MAPPPANRALRLITRWERFWNTRDLDEFDALFLAGSDLTYFSSEKQAVLRGPDAVREHHRGFGFAPGGAATPNRLWLEVVTVDRVGRDAAVVTATWLFRRASTPERIQRGPLTAVLVQRPVGWRIAHMAFGNWPAA